jgi:hypothetical protein
MTIRARSWMLPLIRGYAWTVVYIFEGTLFVLWRLAIQTWWIRRRTRQIYTQNQIEWITSEKTHFATKRKP